MIPRDRTVLGSVPISKAKDSSGTKDITYSCSALVRRCIIKTRVLLKALVSTSEELNQVRFGLHCRYKTNSIEG